MKKLKAILYIFSVALFLVAAYLYVVLVYGHPIPLKVLSGLRVASSTSGRSTNVSIDGAPMNSALVITGVNQFRWGHRIIVVVREGVTRHGRDEVEFPLHIIVPQDVDEIAFGDFHDVIWHRQ